MTRGHAMMLLLSRSSHGEALAAAAAAHTERGTVRESIESLPVSRPRTPSFYEEERVSGSWEPATKPLPSGSEWVGRAEQEGQRVAALASRVNSLAAEVNRMLLAEA